MNKKIKRTIISASVVALLSSGVTISDPLRFRNFNYGISANAIVDINSYNQVYYSNSSGDWMFYLTSSKNSNVVTATLGSFTPATNIKSVTIPSTVKNAKGKDSNNEEFKVNITVTAIHTNSMSNKTALERITIPSTIERIDVDAFKGCTNLKSVYFSSNSKLKIINNNAFSNCKSLKTINLPNTTESIGGNAFENCISLQTFTIPKSVKRVGQSSFKGCTNLNTIYANVDVLESEIAVLAGCNNLKYINNEQIILNNDINPSIQKIFSNYDYGDFSPIDNIMKEKIKKIAEQETQNCKNNLQKAKVLHDWICKKVYYDIDEKWNNDNHTDYSVFLNDNTVCNGYARAYALLMQAAGVETYYVTGNQEYSEEDGKYISHAWNIVKLGNSYFHVDCCWDDSTNDRTGTQYGYDNFMINDDLAKLKKYHKETNIKYPSALYNRYDNKATAICDIKIGDISGDGSILLDDYNLIKSYITHTNTVPLTDVQLRAADVNLDGKTDLTDLSYYSIYINSNPTVNFKTYLITNKTN